MQQCDDLSYTQQLQRQEYETDRMRAQDRATQEMKDHEMAMKLAAELENSQLSSQPTPNAPPTAAPQSQRYLLLCLQSPHSSAVRIVLLPTLTTLLMGSPSAALLPQSRLLLQHRLNLLTPTALPPPPLPLSSQPS
jgi:hypothetical protein